MLPLVTTRREKPDAPDVLPMPASFALTAASWRRPEIEAAVEWLIGLLDARDADADLEPDPEGERGDDLVGDEDDAEDALPLERMRRRVRGRIRQVVLSWVDRLTLEAVMDLGLGSDELCGHERSQAISL